MTVWPAARSRPASPVKGATSPIDPDVTIKTRTPTILAPDRGRPGPGRDELRLGGAAGRVRRKALKNADRWEPAGALGLAVVAVDRGGDHQELGEAAAGHRVGRARRPSL
ncbi:hypothetical protein Adu01nite_18630 [Paractinoplanes durhamensis]|uniref:Uncharacterized protein n=1 Tax=Paractinoplanes durhamensis TaxID=113563 RepID=A0ABQ3YSH0_9ACTN|nr:hypothetical protein Adu01nite_18630 [Actinoplanes durhamensis]